MSETHGTEHAEPGTGLLERADEQEIGQHPWATIVWDDPVTLMSYVTYVFVTYFRYPPAQAERLMLKVHKEGKAVVSSGTREEVERDVAAMHSYGLQATVSRGE
ncbi:ATP-dependent Clp protease adapter ClpS [Propionicicella superfundia]|uniref:ATP-dependent Clp protease adapter ClpS n=1 Tax=Propionicicella superfundia TaxID=348582 RepID=UPI0003F58F34|nr:ATP-dependent Clp protease adapter ClpS [Propionicicella superfundia]